MFFIHLVPKTANFRGIGNIMNLNRFMRRSTDRFLFCYLQCFRKSFGIRNYEIMSDT